MLKNIAKSVLLMFLMVLSQSTAACSFHSKVTGRVVNAVTGDPIEGASIAIHWQGYKFNIEMVSGDYTIEKVKVVSDKDGYFQIPRYFFKSFDMGVYKRGYVCWDAKNNFLQGEPVKVKRQSGVKTYRIKDRTGFRVKDGIVIELEPFTATDMEVRARHASFVRNISRNTGGLEGIGEEIQLYRKYYLNKE